MSIAELRRSGHWPTLLAAFVYFDISFCIWYLLGPLGNFIADDLQLSATQKGFLIATPLLGGSIFRIVLGAFADHLGPRRTGLVGIAITFVPLLLGWQFADSLPSSCRLCWASSARSPGPMPGASSRSRCSASGA